MNKRVTLKINFQVPEDFSDADIVEWIEFITGQNGSIKNENPLTRYEANDLDESFHGVFNLQINNNVIK